MPKQCNKCNQIKQFTDFHKRKNSKDGYRSICKNCHNEHTSRPKYICSYCKKSCWSKGNPTKCSQCRLNESEKKFEGVIIGDKIYTKHKYAKYAYIRFHAQRLAKKLGWKICVKCGYDKHIEVAHIKAISSFSSDTLMSIVNSKDNLIALCPNCHWEFDNGIAGI